MFFRFLIPLILLSLTAHCVFAQSSPSRTQGRIRDFTINASSLFRDNEKEVVVLEGQVQIVRGDQHINADRAVIYMKSAKIEIYGNVRVTTATQTLIGDEILLDYESSTGLITSGYVKSGNVFFEGDLLQKTGETEFFVTDAMYTACTNCPYTWSFTGSSIRAEVGGYAYIKNTVMRVGGVPVLWLPYLVVPLKSERQSGLLTPSFGSSAEGGSEFAQPYFWAIDRSSDMTITVKSFERRSLMGLVNYRYILSETSLGELDVQWIRDRVFSRATRFTKYRTHPQTSSDFNRWYLYYKQQLDLSNGWSQRTLLHNASDLQYPRDFEREIEERGLMEPAFENRVSFTKNRFNFHTSLDSSYYTNLLRADPLSNNDDAVHRMPEITFSQSLSQIGETPFYLNWRLQYTNFARSFQPYDDLTTGPLSATNPGTVVYPENSHNSPFCENMDKSAGCQYVFDGVYNPETDLIRTGQRIDFNPQVQAHLRVANALDLIPKVSYRETRYFFPVGDNREVARRYLRTELGTRTTFGRIYGEPGDKKVRYKHIIEPEVTYSNIPWTDLEEHPFFPQNASVTTSVGSATSVSDGDLLGNLGVQFDENDRLLDRNLVTFAFTNRLIQKLWSGDSAHYRQVVGFRLSQSYNLNKESQRAGISPWSDLAGVLTITFDNVETYTSFNYFPKQNVTNVRTRTALINDQGQFFEIGLERTYKIVQDQRRVERDQRVEDLSFGLGFRSNPVNFVGQFVYDTNWRNSTSESQIKSWGYVVQLKPPGECWQINITHGQRVGADTRFYVGFEFNFDGVPKPAPPRSTLDQFR